MSLKQVFSDHAQVKRTINGIDVYSNNASFVILSKFMKEEGPWGFEEMFVRAVLNRENEMADLFEKFMWSFQPPVVGVQEATLTTLSLT